MFFDVGLELGGVELAPFAPTLFRGERAGFGRRQIAVNRAPPQIKPPGRLGLGATRVKEFDHPFPQVQRICLHAPKLIRLCANVYMNCYSWNIIKEIFKLADDSWSKKRIVSGLGSGEGVVNAVRDPQTERDEQGRETTIAGVDDKRLMVVESEFASVLSVSGRDGSTLSEVLRNAWDSGDIQTLTKNNPIRTTGAHISIIGHITENELNKKLGDNAIFNGFANRFLPVCAKRARLLPDGGSLTDESFHLLADDLKTKIDAARKVSGMNRTATARELWHEVYPKLTADRPGNFGAITSRAEAHVLRLSMIYALLDGSSQIELCHLKAALECWRYCQDSARYIWGDFTQNAIAEKIRVAFSVAGANGLTRSQLNGALGGRITVEEFAPELGKMISRGEVVEFSKPTAGRPVTIYRLRA